MIDAISGALKGTKNGILFVCLSFGHTYDPVLVAEALRRLQKFSGMRIVPFVEFSAIELTLSVIAIVPSSQEFALYRQLDASVRRLNAPWPPISADTLADTDYRGVDGIRKIARKFRSARKKFEEEPPKFLS